MSQARKRQHGMLVPGLGWWMFEDGVLKQRTLDHRRLNQWIGSRENLQETIDFSH